MSEYTLCYGNSCPLKNECYRYTAFFYGKQNYFATPPYNSSSKTCSHIISNEQQIKKIAYYIWLENKETSNNQESNWEEAKKKLIQIKEKKQ